MLLLALTNLFCAPGGIPAFNCLLVRAAAEYARAQRRELRVIVQGDALGTAAEGELEEHFPRAYLPCGGDRRRLLSAVFKEWPRRPTLLLGHVNLAPVGLAFGGLMPGPGFGVVAHGTDVWTALPILRRLALRRATAVACVSDHTARCVHLVQGVDASRCVRVINALPEERFAPTPGRPLTAPTPREGTRLLSVTRLHPGEPKGIDLVLRALRGLPRSHYTVAGEGEALQGLRALAVELGVGHQVTFTGRVSDGERERLLRECDVFVLPSSGEGFGIVYLEAMACGKPCVAARVGGAPEVVLDGETGLVVPPAEGPLLEGLRALLRDGSLRARMGEAGRRRVQEHFRYPHFRERAIRLFERLG